MTKDSINVKKLLKGAFIPANYAKAVVFGICLVVLLGVGFSVFNTIQSMFGKKKSATSETSVGVVEAGGVSTITNINNPLPTLKQGVYVRAASDRASIGVFKEVMPNIDICIGGGKDYDDKAFLEVEARFKF